MPDCLSLRRGQGLREASLEEELLPAIEQFLVRTREIDPLIEAAHEAEVERVQAAMAMEALAHGPGSTSPWRHGLRPVARPCGR